jgi:hypothetical protein
MGPHGKCMLESLMDSIKMGINAYEMLELKNNRCVYFVELLCVFVVFWY